MISHDASWPMPGRSRIVVRLSQRRKSEVLGRGCVPRQRQYRYFHAKGFAGFATFVGSNRIGVVPRVPGGNMMVIRVLGPAAGP